MRIQHNIMAMNAYRNYNVNTSALAKNLEKLSSGYKINRAGDDAAGLAISEKMRAQITGLNAAQKNVKDGISLVKTAEGAMQEIQDMLNRMDYLATQSANGTYDNEVDRANLQKEVTALKTEIDRIADSANFNGIKLLDGSLTTTTTTESLGDPAINATYIADESKNGIEPTAAKAAKYTVKLAGLDTTQAATVASVKANNTTVTAAAGASQAKFETDSVASTTAGDIKVTVNYKDAAGKDQTKELTVTTTTTTAATTASEIANAINADNDLKALFTAAVTNTDKITLTAKTAGSGKGSVSSIAVANGTAGAASVGANSTTTVAVDAGSYDLSKFGDDAANDTITVNGKEYKAADYADFDALKAQLVSEGYAVTGNDDGTNVKIMGKQVDSKIGGSTVTGGTTAISDLGTMQIDGKNIKDQFKVTIDGNEVTDWTATDKIAAGAEIKFEAKIPGKVSSAVETAFKADGTNVANATVTVDQAGVNEDSAGEATKAKYELTFNFNNLAGNQRVKVGDKIYELSTSGVKADPSSSNVLIDLRGMDPTTTTGKQAIANAIHTAISTGLGAGNFSSTAPTVADGDTNVSMSFEAVAAGSAGNKGNIQVFDNPAAVTGTYTAGKEAANKDAARPTSVVYAVDLDKLAVGDKITLGSGNTAKTVEIVADDKADPGAGKITLANAKNATKLTEAFYAQGYNQVVTIANGKMTISAAQQTAGGGTGSDNAPATAAQFAAGAGKVVFSSNTPTSKTTTTGDPLQLQIGDTSDKFNRMDVSVGDMHVSAMFSLERDADGNLVKDAQGNTIKTSDNIKSIDISTQAGAQAAVNVIKDAINYVSSVRGDLGAIQNRLDHTAKNLSVMAENIQDAESTIRDTDVAEEMMAYTKNNILIQSAQAMLAQANAVPQGVLQLLG